MGEGPPTTWTRPLEFFVKQERGIKFLRFLGAYSGDDPDILRMEKALGVAVDLQDEQLRAVLASRPRPRSVVETYIEDSPFKDFLLWHGTEYQGVYSGAVKDFPTPHWRCFETAAKLAQERDDLLYAEGIGISPSAIMKHAWNVRVADGVAVDYTWPFANLNTYFGLTFTNKQRERLGSPHCAFFGYWGHFQSALTDLFENNGETGIS